MTPLVTGEKSYIVTGVKSYVYTLPTGRNYAVSYWRIYCKMIRQ